MKNKDASLGVKQGSISFSPRYRYSSNEDELCISFLCQFIL